MVQHAQTHQFKKVAIPLLLAVGALLLVMCIAMGVMLLTGTMGKGDLRPHVAFVVAALLVSLILLGGAWWFHKEIRADQQRQEQLAQFQQQQQGTGQPPQQQ
jgi:protein-S-isoprenylcysteine O-methyltransferase Ste14